MYTVDLYRRVRLACHVEGLSQRKASKRFGGKAHQGAQERRNGLAGAAAPPRATPATPLSGRPRRSQWL
jgi:hypothetical protein